MSFQKERIIPIQVEGRDEPSETSGDKKEQQNLNKSMEELSVDKDLPKTDSVKRPIQVKSATSSSNDEQEYLKEFDVLEKREGNSIVTGYSLPNINTPERIFLVIDKAQDENYSPFLANNQKYTPLSMLKRAVSIFIKLKLNINPFHQFGIIAMNESNAQLLLSPTHDARKLNDCLNKIKECETEDIFDLNTVFNIIMEDDIPQQFTSEIHPSHVLRAIIFYGRSYTLPKVTMTDKITELLNNPFFTCDVLMTHEPVEISNHCGKIFDVLQNLDKKGTAYFFPVGRDL